MAKFPSLPVHEWSALRSELIWIYDQPVAPGSRRQSFARKGGHWAWLLREGSLRFRHASGDFRVRPGVWFFVPPGPARQEFSADARLLSVHFLCQWPSGEPLIRQEKPLSVSAGDFPVLERRAIRLVSLVRRHFPLAANYKLQSAQPVDGRIYLRLQAFFQSWLESWLDVCLARGLGWSRLRSGDDRVLAAARCLNDAPLDQAFPGVRLRKLTGLSEVHLNRLFLEEFGMTPKKHWEQRRLAQAKGFLETSLMPVKEISWRLGFRTDSHFAVWFRQRTGRRPSAWRKNAENAVQ